MRPLHPYVLLALILVAPGAASAQKAAFDYDAERKRKKAELERVLEQRKKVNKAIKKDRADFEAYKARTQKRTDAIRKRTKEIQDGTGAWRKKLAARGATIGHYRRKTRGFAQRQKIFRERLVSHCDALMVTARSLPPLLSKKAVSVLDYLKSELKAGSVDNIEGLHRLVRIARRMDAQLMDVQVTQGSSPIPQITGTVQRLRLGGVFEAVARGDQAAIWDFERKKWILLKDPVRAKMIVTAIEVRTGKQKPALVRVPLGGVRPLATKAAPKTETRAEKAEPKAEKDVPAPTKKATTSKGGKR